MTTWKTKLFGDNRMNFYGWVVTGFLLVFASIGAVALAPIFRDAAQLLMLLAIYMILAGHFCLALQNYLSRVAKAIEADGEQKE